MLRDRPRQIAYRDAIHQNRDKFRDKVVLDVGAGTGILSILCAKAGARRVYAVEASQVANIASRIVEENDVADIVQVSHCKIEDFTLPANETKVDIIISEWMGFYLLHEGMLDSVLWARDHFLRDDGLMFPSCATISLAPCSVPSRFADWSEVDGVKMTALGAALRQQKSFKPEVIHCKVDDLLHEGTVMAWLDLREVTSADLEQLTFNEVIVANRSGRYEGVCIWFDCEFPLNDNGESVVLSTAPTAAETHWQQTVVVLPEHGCFAVEARDPIAFQLNIRRNGENRRRYNMEMEMIDADAVEHALPCDCIMTKCILAKAHLATLQTTEDAVTEMDAQ